MSPASNVKETERKLELYRLETERLDVLLENQRQEKADKIKETNEVLKEREDRQQKLEKTKAENLTNMENERQKSRATEIGSLSGSVSREAWVFMDKLAGV